ncbi:MAG: hypothetical protein [Microviridae sp. ctD0m35]|nr:MAG: hypothetical protein [Microviridae sp. ctudC31]QGH72991.1 MAG: hypothetical protein [Microviridae sp. ctD0m35]
MPDYDQLFPHGSSDYDGSWVLIKMPWGCP